MVKNKIKKDESHFLAFDPSDYTEVDQYKDNPAFKSDETNSLLPVANKALVFFLYINRQKRVQVYLIIGPIHESIFL